MPPTSIDTCTTGMAEALFEELPVVAHVMLPRGQHHPGLLDAASKCQYRLFWDGRTIAFCEADVILGGIVWWWDYKKQGVTRAAAIADFEKTTDRVWLDGVEQPLQRTTYKDLDTPDHGLIVYQQRAFIRQLPPGDHESVWVSTYPGLPDQTATVTLHVLPSALCP